MGVFSNLSTSIEELLSELGSGKVFGGDVFYFTQYTIWLIIASLVLLAIIFAVKKRLTVVPGENKLVNGTEMIVESLRRDMGENIIGRDSDKHMGLILTVFFFILINNLIGLIPGAKPGTGTFGVTIALALVVFIYFNYYGMKAQGAGRYIINLAPKGVVLPLACLVWCIEVVSLVLRLFTLAIRLFANMYAGHIVLGVFSLLTSMFLIYAIQNAAYLTALPAIGWMALLIVMYAMELLVACIQAYVFSLLTAVYIGLATGEE